MKTHAIIPIFIPHKGCPNDCIFCNQKKITSNLEPMTKESVVEVIERNLPTISNRGITTVEVAFFGGSFTGIPIPQQTEYLSIAKRYKDKGLIHKIRLSTRPDYIDHEILTNLKNYDVDIIELGVQSFDEEVLKSSNRGHNAAVVYESSNLIMAYGFQLGIQLMVGLPGDTYEKDLFSARETVKIGPAIARIYPTIVIEDTGLYDLQASGAYTALSQGEAVRRSKDVYLILKEAGINVIRIGLKNTFGAYHPAFRQLVESEIAKEQLEAQLKQDGDTLCHGTFVNCYSNGKSFSNMVGNGKSNKLYFKKKFPHIGFGFRVDQSLEDGVYLVKLSAPQSTGH
ncbi:MAG: radical SAM protein [Anaerovorax sp.]